MSSATGSACAPPAAENPPPSSRHPGSPVSIPTLPVKPCCARDAGLGPVRETRTLQAPTTASALTWIKPCPSRHLAGDRVPPLRGNVDSMGIAAFPERSLPRLPCQPAASRPGQLHFRQPGIPDRFAATSPQCRRNLVADRVAAGRASSARHRRTVYRCAVQRRPRAGCRKTVSALRPKTATG